MQLRIGPPATGDNSYPRPALTGKLLRALERGNVAFLGPRRTGKTSCLEQIHAQPGPFVPILLNLEKHDTVEAWLQAMLAELRRILEQPKGWKAELGDRALSLIARIQQIEVPGVGGVEMAGSPGKAQWRRPAEALALLDSLPDTSPFQTVRDAFVAYAQRDHLQTLAPERQTLVLALLDRMAEPPKES